MLEERERNLSLLHDGRGNYKNIFNFIYLNIDPLPKDLNSKLDRI